MNIALSAVIISILLIPPVIFYLSLYTGNAPKPAPKFSLFEAILASAVVSLFIHAIAICCISSDIRFDILVKVLGGDLKNLEGTVPNPVFKQAVIDFAIYMAVIIAVMVLLGRLFRWLLRYKNRHAASETLHIYNKWWYFFNGFYASVDAFDLIFVDAVVDTHDGTMIYSGFLVHYDTDSGNLDRIYLQDVLRREFKRYESPANDRLVNEPGTGSPIPGETLSIRYADILSLNVNFITVADPEPQQPAEAQQMDMPIL